MTPKPQPAAQGVSIQRYAVSPVAQMVLQEALHGKPIPTGSVTSSSSATLLRF
jgi:hypothetical protein